MSVLKKELRRLIENFPFEEIEADRTIDQAFRTRRATEFYITDYFKHVESSYGMHPARGSIFTDQHKEQKTAERKIGVEDYGVKEKIRESDSESSSGDEGIEDRKGKVKKIRKNYEGVGGFSGSFEKGNRVEGDRNGKSGSGSSSNSSLEQKLGQERYEVNKHLTKGGIDKGRKGKRQESVSSKSSSSELEEDNIKINLGVSDHSQFPNLKIDTQLASRKDSNPSPVYRKSKKPENLLSLNLGQTIPSPHPNTRNLKPISKVSGSSSSSSSNSPKVLRPSHFPDVPSTHQPSPNNKSRSSSSSSSSHQKNLPPSHLSDHAQAHNSKNSIDSSKPQNPTHISTHTLDDPEHSSSHHPVKIKSDSHSKRSNSSSSSDSDKKHSPNHLSNTHKDPKPSANPSEHKNLTPSVPENTSNPPVHQNLTPSVPKNNPSESANLTPTTDPSSQPSSHYTPPFSVSKQSFQSNPDQPGCCSKCQIL